MHLSADDKYGIVISVILAIGQSLKLATLWSLMGLRTELKKLQKKRRGR